MSEVRTFRAVEDARLMMRSGSPWRLAVRVAARVHSVDADLIAWHVALARASQFEARRAVERGYGSRLPGREAVAT